MKNYSRIACLGIILIVSISTNTSAQFQRILNTDTLFFEDNLWKYRNNDSIPIAFDSTKVIVKFNNEINKSNIISFLQNNNITLIDSLFEYKLCKLNNSFTFSRSIDSLTAVSYFSHFSIDYPAFENSYPNDTLLKSQLHINDSNRFYTGLFLDSAWQITKGNPNVIVAVIDHNPDWSHEDIGDVGNFQFDNIWENPGEDVWADQNDPSTGDGIDNDNNGFIDDWKGWNFMSDSNDVRPKNSTFNHGTNVMGVLAAKSNNQIGVAGIAGGDYANTENPVLGVQLLPINIFDDPISSNVKVTSGWALASAIQYAASQRVNIITLSMSFNVNRGSSPFKIDIVEEALDIARNNYGCMIFCSAGNGLKLALDYPSSNENVHSVSALSLDGKKNNQRLGDYNNGKVLAFVALGEQVGTTSTNNGYIGNFSMTSAASPQASGVASLILSYNNCITNYLAYEIMKETASKDFGENPDSSSYIYDNNTNSNSFGYGKPNAYRAISLIDSFTINNYNINTNATWSTTKIANQDIIITTGNTLTVSGYLNMAENTKIVVQAGANLIVDGAEISSACGWEGIKVYGIANQAQNASTFGEVRIINNAKLSYARIAVESINGGILVSNTDATYRNNKSAIVINKHKFDNAFTEIEDSHFISDGPYLSKTNKISRIAEGIKEFINLNGTQLMIINDCTFENTSELKYTHQANAINAYSTNYTQIINCEFNGMFRAIDAVAYNGLLNTIIIENSVFNDNLQGIRVVNSTANIYDNQFNLPYMNSKFNNLFTNNSTYGIYTFGSVNYIRNNDISSYVETSAALGIIVRNSRALNKSYVEYNQLSNLSIGTQIEQYNKQLQISCNDYSNINKHAWSLNPQFTSGSGIFPMQGSDLDPLPTNQKRAGNLFYDRDLPSNSLRHIKSSFEFTYNAANSPTNAVPEYVSTDVIVSTFGELNFESCIGGAFQLILCNDEPCIFDELEYLLGITLEEDSLTIIKQAMLKYLLDNQNYDLAIDYLEVWNTNQANLEFLFETLLSNEENESATTVLESYSVVDERDQDYFDFYSILLNQLNEQIPADSLTSYELGIIQDIASRNNDVSDLAKAYLNYFSLDYFTMEPEEWESESLRITNKSETKNSKKPIIETRKFNVSIFPNPMAEQFNVFISSANTKEVFKLEITNTLGQNVLNQDQLIANSKINIDVSTLPTGVFYLKITNASGEKSVKRISIVR